MAMAVDTSECVCMCVRVCQQRRAHHDKWEKTRQIKSAVHKREKDIQLFACSMFRHTGGAQLDSPCQVSQSSSLPNGRHLFSIAAVRIIRTEMNGVTLV